MCKQHRTNVVLTAFATRVRAGKFGRGKQVSVGEVAKALAAISKMIELAGEERPVYPSFNKYTLPIERLMEGFRREDPPPVPQLAVPVKLVRHLHTTSQNESAADQAVGDLAIT